MEGNLVYSKVSLAFSAFPKEEINLKNLVSDTNTAFYVSLYPLTVLSDIC